MQKQWKHGMKRLTAMLLSLMFLFSTVEPAGFYAFAAELSGDESVVTMAEESASEEKEESSEEKEEPSEEKEEPQEEKSEEPSEEETAEETKEAAAEEETAEEPKEEAPEEKREEKAEEEEKTEADSEKQSEPEQAEPEQEKEDEETEAQDSAPAVAMPAFAQQAELDGVKIKVTAEEGVFPENSYLLVKKVSKKEQKAADEAVEEVRDSERLVAASYTFDIKVVDGEGNELQPAEGKTVNVSFTTDEVKEKLLTTEVYHITEDEKKPSELVAEALEVEENTKKGIATAETDGFSTYKVVFSYEKMTYEVDADASAASKTVTLKDIMKELDLNGNIFNVTVGESSQSGVVSVAYKGTATNVGGTGGPSTDAKDWEITTGTTGGFARLDVALYKRPTYYITVQVNDVAASTHQIILRHMDGKPVTSGNPARASEVLEVYVTGYTSSEMDNLYYYYKKDAKNIGTSNSVTFTHYNDISGTSFSSATARAKGYRFIRFFGSNGNQTEQPGIAVFGGTGKTGIGLGTFGPKVPESDVKLTTWLQNADLQSDLNDVARALHPVITRIGETSNNLLDQLNDAGIAHLTGCTAATKPKLSATGYDSSLTVTANQEALSTTVKGSKYGHYNVTFTLAKNECGFHKNQTGTIPFDIYVLNKTYGEQVGKNIQLTNTNEWCSYTLKKDGVVVAGPFTYAEMQEKGNLFPLSAGKGTYTVEETVTEIDFLSKDDKDDKKAIQIKGQDGNAFSVEVTHEHNWSYALKSNDPSTIVATCNGGEDCDITTGKELTISAPANPVYTVESGAAKAWTATLNTGYNTTAFPSPYTIKYYQGETEELAGAPSNAGTYTAKVTVTKGDATYTAEKSFTISPKKLTDKELDNITFSFKANGNGTHVYDGTDWTPAVENIVVKYNGKEVPFTAEFPEKAAVVRADYPITVTLGGNYAGNTKENAGTYSITKAQLTVNADAKSKVYRENDPELTYKTVGLVEGDSLTGELTRTEGENVGEYDIIQGTLDAGKNYDLAFTGAKLTINPLDIEGKYTIVVTVTPASNTYTGSENKPAVSVKLKPTGEGNEIAVKDADFSVAYNPAEVIKAGKYVVTVTLGDNYKRKGETASQTAVYAITKKPNAHPAAPSASDMTATKDSPVAGVENGSIAIAQYNKDTPMEYSDDNGETWKTVPESGVIGNSANGATDGLSNGTYQIRYKGDENTEPSEALGITVGAKEAQNEAPKAGVVYVSEAGKKDGAITGVDDTMEYSTDGTTWTKVTPEQAQAGKIEGLDEGIYQVRYAETADKGASPAQSVKIGAKTPETAPTKPTLTASGSTVTVSEPQKGVKYTLMKDNNPIGEPITYTEGILVFSNLDPNTEYQVVAVKPGNGTTTKDSAPVSSNITTAAYTELTDATKPTISITRSGETVAGNQPQIGDTLTAKTDAAPVEYEWYYAEQLEDGKPKSGETAKKTGNTYNVTKDDLDKRLVAVAMQTKDSAGNDLSAPKKVNSESTDAVTKKTGPAAPAALNAEDIATTDTTITVNSAVPQGKTYEYSIDGGTTWQDSNAFTGRTPGTTYPVSVREKVTDPDMHEGKASTINVTTNLGVSIEGKLTNGQTLTAKVVPENAEGLAYEWYRVDKDGQATAIVGATGDKYTLTDADLDKKIQVKVTSTRPTTNGTATTTDAVSNATAPAIGTQPTRGDAPVVYGKASDGRKITGPEITNTGALDKVAYQWYCDGEPISGATGKDYEIPNDTNAGEHEYYCVVTNNVTGGGSAATTSETVTVKIAKAKPTINTNPTAGAITFGQKLSDSTLTDGAASVPGTFAWSAPNTEPDAAGEKKYQVTFTPGDTTNYNTVTVNVPVTVKKAESTKTTKPIDENSVTTTKDSVTINPAEAGQVYIVVPKGKTPNEEDWKSSKKSEDGKPVTIDGLEPGTEYVVYSRIPAEDGNHEPSAPQTTPVVTKLDVDVSGTGKEGEALSATVQPANGTYTYKWYRDGEEITGATGATYTPNAEDVGKTIKVVVSSQNPETSGTASTSTKVTGAERKVDKPEQTTGGTVDTIQPENPKTGDTVTVTLTPDPGYKATGVKVVQKAEPHTETTAEKVDGQENTFTYTQPGYDVVLEPVFTKLSYSIANPETVQNGKVELDGVTKLEGSTAIDNKHASVGDTVKLKVTPDANYALKSITVDYKDDSGATQTFSVTKNQNGEYTFTMPAANVTAIVATFSSFTALNSSDVPTIAITRGGNSVEDNKPQIGDVLTAKTTATPVEYQWYYVDESGQEQSIEGANGETYKVTAKDVNKSIKVKITQEKDAGGEGNPAADVTVASKPTDAVAKKSGPQAPNAPDKNAITTTTDSKAEPATSTITVKPAEPGQEYIVVPKGTEPKDYNWTDAKSPAQGQDSVTFDGLTPGKEYDVITRVAATDDTEAGTPSDPTSITTNKATQAAPAEGDKPEIKSQTADSITIKNVKENLEYVICDKDGNPLKDGDKDRIITGKTAKNGELTIDGLESDSKYIIKARKPGDDEHKPSPSVDLTAQTKAKTPGQFQVEATDQTIVVTPAEADKDDEKMVYTLTDAQGKTVLDEDNKPVTGTKGENGKITFPAQPNQTYKVTAQRLSKGEGQASDVVESQEVKTPKTGSKPLTDEEQKKIKAEAFNKDKTTNEKVVVNGVPGYEYLLVDESADERTVDWSKAAKCTEEGGDFAKSEGDNPTYTKEFDKLPNGTALTEGTNYKILVRKSETDTAKASQSVEVLAYTKAPAPDGGYTKDYANEKIKVEDGYEIIAVTPDGQTKPNAPTNWTEGVIEIDLEPGVQYQIRQKEQKDESGKVTKPESMPATIPDETRPKVKPIGDVTKTDTTITVNPSVEGQQYIVVRKGTTPSEDDWTNSKTGNGGALEFDNLSPDTEYEVITRVPAKPDKLKSEEKKKDVTTKRSEPVIDAEKLIAEQKLTTITVNTQQGYEYILTDSSNPPAEAEWANNDHYYKEKKEKGTHVFGQNPESPLEAGKQYYVHVRQAATEAIEDDPATTDKDESQPAKEPSMPKTVPTSTQQAAPTADEAKKAVEVDYTQEKLTAKTGYEIQDSQGNWVKEIKPFQPDTEYPVRKAEQPAANGNPAIPASDGTNYKTPARPDAPAMVSNLDKDDKSITIKSTETNQEYIVLPAKEGGYTAEEIEAAFRSADVTKTDGNGLDQKLTTDSKGNKIQPGKDYVVYNRYKAVTEGNEPKLASKPNGPATVKTKTSSQSLTNEDKNKVKDAFNKPESTDTKIVVNGVPGYEYLLVAEGTNESDADWSKAAKCTTDGDDFNKSEGDNPTYTKEFTTLSNGTQLEKNTNYKILVRRSETDEAMASNPESYAAYTTRSAPNPATDGYDVSYPKEQITAKDGYEIRKKGDNSADAWKSSLTAEPGVEYEVRQKEGSPEGAHESEPASFKLSGRPNAPAAVKATQGEDNEVTKTNNSITINPAQSTQEYIVVPKDATADQIAAAWTNASTVEQNGPLTISKSSVDGTTPIESGKEYKVLNRIKATNSSFASLPSDGTVVKTKTDPAAVPADETKQKGTNPTTITIDGKKGMEYLLVPKGTTADDIDWSKATKAAADGPIEFNKTSGTKSKPDGENLTQGTDYEVISRVAETGDAMPSQSRKDTVYTSLPAPEDGTGHTEDYPSERIEVKPGYEIRVKAPNEGGVQPADWTEGTEDPSDTQTPKRKYITLTPGTEYEIREKEVKDGQGNVTKHESEPTTFETAQRPATPSPVPSDAIRVRDTSLTIDSTVVGQEYIVVPKGTNPTEEDWANGKDGNGGALTFDGLTSNTEYEVITRVKATDTKPHSDPAPTEVKTKTSQSTPTNDDLKDLVKDQTDTSITINAKAGYEYVVTTSEQAPTDEDWSKVNGNGYFKTGDEDKEHTFEGLQSGTKYYVHARLAETSEPAPGKYASPAVTVPAKTKYSKPDTEPTAEAKGPTTIVVKPAKSDEQYSIDGGKTWVDPSDDEVRFENLEPGKEYEVVSRKKADDNGEASEASAPAKVTTPKAKVDAPVVQEVTDKSITVEAEPGFEYSIDGGNTWTKAKENEDSVTFDNLESGKTYNVVTRKAGTEEASVPVEAKTEKKQDSGDENQLPAPTVGEATSTTITVKPAQQDQEYIVVPKGKTLTEEDWNKAKKPEEGKDEVKFENLESGQNYEVVSRKAATATESASEPSESAPVATTNSGNGTVTAEVEKDDKLPPTEVQGVDVDMAQKAKGQVNEEMPNSIKDNDDLKLYLKMTDITATQSDKNVEEDKQLCETLVDNAAPTTGHEIIQYFDVSMFLKRNNDPKTETQIHNLPKAITLTFTIPNSAKTADKRLGRVFMVVKVHQGKASVVGSTKSEDVITVTDKLSTYALAYRDTYAIQGAPESAPNAKAENPTTIVVKPAVEGEEYSIDGGKTWVKPTNGEVRFENLTPGKEYEVTSRMARSGRNLPSDETKSTKVTTLQAEQAAPKSAPEAKAENPTTIVVKPAAEDEEYSIDGGKTWVKPSKGETRFENLTPGKEYEVVSRKTGDDQHKPSAPSAGTKVTTPKAEQEAPKSAPAAKAENPTTIVVKSAAEDEEYSIDGGKTWVKPTNGETRFENLTPGKDYEVVSRKAGTDTKKPSAPSAGTKVTTPKAEQSAPKKAPSIKGVTHNSITVGAVDGEEYSIDGGKTWKKAKKGEDTVVFTGLKQGKTYEVVSRKAGTDTKKPSPASKPAKQKTKTLTTEQAINKGLKVSQTGSQVNVAWGKVKGADGYKVFVQYCGEDFNKKPDFISKKANVNSAVIKKINGKKLNLKNNYKIVVVAFKLKGGKQVKICQTITAHIVGRENTNFTNVKGIRLNRSKFTLRKGRSAQVKGSVVLVNKSRKQLTDAHAPQFRYTSTDKKVAVVNKNGKITAKGKGVCTVFVYARNGYAKEITVTVK